LDAGSDLFDARGFDRTTVREIGEQADVDPALIARYFGGKQGLYLAVLADQDSHGTARQVDPAPSALAQAMLENMDQGRGAPVLSAMVAPDPDPEVRNQVQAILDSRILRGVAAELSAHVVGNAERRLRAETMLAMLVGVVLARGNGTLAELARAPREELLELLGPALELLRG
jgi:AcrR family transcriptional regulator